MELKEFDTMLRGFDWYYHMSDDHRVWRAGETARAKIVAAAKTSAEHRELYEFWSKHYFSGAPWGTENFTREMLDAERQRLGVA
jgi:predicted deacetylase